MKNTIYKNFAKKILKSEAFVSVVIVFVLALGIIGTSYALYMDIDTDTNYQLVEVGDLSIGFNNGSSKIELKNMTPTSDDVAINGKDNLTSFYIYNEGTYTANYNIKLVPNTSNTVETKYIKYQICRDNANNCKDINTLNETGETIIYTDELTPNSTALDTNNTNPSAYYFIRLWISDEYNVETAQTISLNIVIDAKNASGYLDNDNTLAGSILNNPNITINNDIPDFSQSETEEKGLYKAPDDYGISYYFRGAQSNNYVSFAGFTWRIVRINGDGTIRMITEELQIPGSSFSLSECRTPKCIGYMFGEDSTEFNIVHDNNNDSMLKQTVDAWYQNNNIDNYKEYLADTIFCGEKTFYSGDGIDNTEYHYTNNSLRYRDSIPSLECAKGVDNDFSRYTKDEYTTDKNVKTNGDLTYPIATISSDEIIMAGASYNQANSSFYLYNSNQSDRYWWTMSTSYFYSSTSAYTFIFQGNILKDITAVNGSGVYLYRPVINLKADILVAGGDGTKEITYDEEGNVLTKGPYTVKLY